jgi:hypothetical protein
MQIKDIIEEYRAAFEEKYSMELLPGQVRALESMLRCRTPECGEMLVECPGCGTAERHPHSCGHRSCPRCQNHESTRWIARQNGKLLPVRYFLVTFTVPCELRSAAYHNQRTFFDALFKASSEAISELASDHRHLGGEIGMTGVLHTNSRRLDLHPHIHYIVPAGALNRRKKLWKRKGGEFLLPHNPLSRLFKGKMLALLKERGIAFPGELHSMKWNIDFNDAGSGEHAVEYLARYLYRGVICEKSIIGNEGGKVTFQYQDSDTKLMETRTLPGEDFLMLVLQHVLPKGFRRAREYGFLHGNAAKTLKLLQLILQAQVPFEKEPGRPAFKCPKCGRKMQVVACRIRSRPDFKERDSPAKIAV